MLFASFFAGLQRRLAAHRKYRQTIAEIASLTQSDLIDIGAFQSDLYRAARKEIYG